MTTADRSPSAPPVLTLGLLADGLIGWGGGLDLLRLVLAALGRSRQSLRLVLLVTALPPRPPPAARALRAWREPQAGAGFVGRLREAYWAAHERSPAHEHRAEVIEQLQRAGTPFELREFNGAAGLRAAVQAARIDVVLPSMQDLGADFPRPWVGYLPDVQHRHLPQMFNAEECAQRDRSFEALLRHADAVVATSQSVQRDLQAFFGRSRAVVALPFAALHPGDEALWTAPPHAAAARYGAAPRYFIVCNQFWKHKAHGDAFEALRLLRQRPGCADVELLCTGSTDDYRNPEYFAGLQQALAEAGLQQAVKILGRIPKHDQMLLVRDAVALLQPSLFEGTQGGMSVADALSLGVRVAAADIAVNTELSDARAHFYRSGDAAALAALMQTLLDAPPPARDHAALEQLAQRRLAAYAEGLLAACDAARAARAAPPAVRAEAGVTS